MKPKISFKIPVLKMRKFHVLFRLFFFFCKVIFRKFCSCVFMDFTKVKFDIWKYISLQDNFMSYKPQGSRGYPNDLGRSRLLFAHFCPNFAMNNIFPKRGWNPMN